MGFVQRIAAALTLTAASTTTAIAEDLEFVLINQSGFTLTEFYTSPSNVNNWEEDVLGQDVLESGYTVKILIQDGRTQCEYDMRMVFADGDILEDTIDMCELGSYTIE